jgi:hypothetical protein
MTTVVTPTFSPVAGEYDTAQSVALLCATGSSTIFYTTDGSTPAETEGYVNTASVGTGGSGYAHGDNVLITAGDGLAELTVNTVDSGVIDHTTVSVANAGSGYAHNDGGHVLTGDGLALYSVDTVVDGVPDNMSVAAGLSEGYAISDSGTINGGDNLGIWQVTGIINGVIKAGATFHVSGAAGGTGYAHGDTGHLTGGAGTGATYTVLHTDGGGDTNTPGIVTDIAILAGGINYVVASGLTTAVDTGTGDGNLHVTIDALGVTNGIVSTFNSAPVGSGYPTGVTGTTNVVGTGSGFTINITSVLNGRVGTFHLTADGTGYSTGTKATDNIAGIGVGFTINILSVINGIVTAFSGFVSHGSGYTNGTKATTKVSGSGDDILTVAIAIINGVAAGSTLAYSAPIAVSATKTIRAIGYKSGSTNSAVASALYIILALVSVLTLQSFLNDLVQTLGALNPFESAQQAKAALALSHLLSNSLTAEDLSLIQSLLSDKYQQLDTAGPYQASQLAEVKQALADVRSLI